MYPFPGIVCNRAVDKTHIFYFFLNNNYMFGKLWTSFQMGGLCNHYEERVVWTNLSIFWNGNRAVDKTHPARSTCLKYKKILTFKTKQIPNTKTSYENTFFAFRFQFELFSCPKQLNRWPCHSLTDSLTVLLLLTCKERP